MTKKNLLSKYTFSFDIFALILFILIMIPNIFWFSHPAPNDVLRKESVTSFIDTVASVFQVIMIATLCLLKRCDCPKRKLSVNLTLMLLSYLVYLLGWILYFNGIASVIIILMLCIAPCFAFAFYALDRKNFLALIPLFFFFVCHLIFCLVNFL